MWPNMARPLAPSSASAEGPWVLGVMHRPCAGRCIHAHASCARRQGTRVQKSKDQVSGLPGLHDGSIASAIGLRVRATCAARSALPVGGGGWCRSGRCSLGLLVCAHHRPCCPPWRALRAFPSSKSASPCCGRLREVRLLCYGWSFRLLGSSSSVSSPLEGSPQNVDRSTRGVRPPVVGRSLGHHELAFE